MARRGTKRTNLPMQQEPFTDKKTAGEILESMFPLFDDEKGESKPAIYSDAVTLENKIKQYFVICSNNGLRPGIIGLLAFVGVSYKEYRNNNEGLVHTISNENLAIVKKAHLLIESYIEQTAACGVLNPVLSIFWMKNYTGLRDTQDISVTPKTDIQATKSLEQIERDIPIDE